MVRFVIQVVMEKGHVAGSFWCIDSRYIFIVSLKVTGIKRTILVSQWQYESDLSFFMMAVLLVRLQCDKLDSSGMGWGGGGWLVKHWYTAVHHYFYKSTSSILPKNFLRWISGNLSFSVSVFICSQFCETEIWYNFLICKKHCVSW